MNAQLAKQQNHSESANRNLSGFVINRKDIPVYFGRQGG